MNIPYRTRLKLQRAGTIVLFIVMVLGLIWFCWVLWLERYVVYSREGATIDFTLSSQQLRGTVATPEEARTDISIFYNEGEDAISTSTELTQLNGYYITVQNMVDDFEGVKARLTALAPNTAVMIEVKNPYDTFYYPSETGYSRSQAVDVDAVAEMINELRIRGLYVIAKVPAFRDYQFGLNNITCGLPIGTGKYKGALWMDNDGYYWLKPTNAGTLNYLTTIVLELKALGFNEVLLSDFQFPASGNYSYTGDKDADLLSAAETLVKSLSTDYFTVSFGVASSTFPLPDGRCRMYLENVAPSSVGMTAAQATVSDADIRLVFVADTNDTRYDAYGVLRPLEVSDALGEGQ